MHKYNKAQKYLHTVSEPTPKISLNQSCVLENLPTSWNNSMCFHCPIINKSLLCCELNTIFFTNFTKKNVILMLLFWPLVPDLKSKFYFSQNSLLTLLPLWTSGTKSLCIWDNFEKDKSLSVRKIIVRYNLTLIWINICVCLWKNKMPPDLHHNVKGTQLIRLYSVTQQAQFMSPRWLRWIIW